MSRRPADFFLVGLSHKSAPIALRERVALREDALEAALHELRDRGVREALILSTCNRVEVYVAGGPSGEARRFFIDRAPDVDGHLYEKTGEDAMRHLFRVASSLDSMVVGESQILGQVKEAFKAATSAGATGQVISRLCHRAFNAAKRVRSETSVARGAGSISQVAVNLVQKIFGDLAGKTILLVGAGKMGELSAKALHALGADRLLITNRSAERAEALARQVIGEPRTFESLPTLLCESDVVLVSTGAPNVVVTRDMVAAAMRKRRHRSLCFIDLAVPRNVEPGCGELDDVYAYDIDDMERVVHATHAARAGEAVRAEAIVEAELMALAREIETRAALPVLAALRYHAESLARIEVERTLAQLGSKLDEKGRRSIEAMGLAIVNKLLHTPTQRLKASVGQGESALAGAAAELFELPSPDLEGQSDSDGDSKPGADVVPLERKR